MRSLIAILFIFVTAFCTAAYGQIPIGQWRSHLPLNRGLFTDQNGDNIYCAAENGICLYHTADKSLEILTKVNSLSDVNIGFMRYYPSRKTLVVYYENGNLDLISESGTTNISDIKRKNIIGSKKVNEITFYDRYAMLSTDFGLLQVDLDRAEIKEAYQMSFTGSVNKVYSCTYDGLTLYAATDSGVYSAPANSPNLNFLGVWTQILAPQPGTYYKNIIWFTGHLLVNFRSGSDDMLYEYTAGNWVNTNKGIYAGQTLRLSNGNLVFAGSYNIKIFDNNLIEIGQVAIGASVSNIRDALFADGITWIADHEEGLVRAESSLQFSFIVPNGPLSPLSSEIEIQDDILWVSHGPRGRKWSSVYQREGFSEFKDNSWSTFNPKTVSSPLLNLDTFFDPGSVAIFPGQAERVFVSSRIMGVLEFENRAVTNYWNAYNSSLQFPTGNPGVTEIGDMAFDQNKNLWIANTASSPLSVYKTDGSWQAFSFPGQVSGQLSAGEMLIDASGRKWVDYNETGILVFDDSRPLGTTRYRLLTSTIGAGGLPSSDVRAMAEDQSGQIWIGTGKGVAVFYSPGSVLEDNVNFDAQQILIYADGSYQYLLETEVVTAIAIDGANRKWFGTENAGVFLVSADGTNELLRFNTSNSPLPSNNITALAINHHTGEVFIGTEKGIVSYRSDATLGKEYCDHTYAFPNPVRPAYEGPIAITGLVNNGRVKITDISGTLVYETNALGGQAIWYGKNFHGEKVKSGVYLIFSSDQDGKNTCITKLLFMN
ncbi:MAG: hypothetical protein IT241_04155 [Bacteroidia bacterium]|nr:hypothetical protein [Bacteroidia bacterium]